MEFVTLLKYLVSMMILFCKSAFVTTTTQHNLRKLTGYKLTGTVLTLVSREDMDASICAISCQPTICKSATYSSTENICMTFQERFYETSITMSVDSAWDVLYVAEDTVQYGDWTLVFRGQSLIQTSVYDVWSAAGIKNDNPLDEVSGKCLRLDNVGGCTQHFRSQILDNWDNIDEVKFALYVDGTEVKNIIFDGTGSTVTSWFNHSLIVSSTWSVLKEPHQFDYFSIEGSIIMSSSAMTASENGVDLLGVDNTPPSNLIDGFVHSGLAERRFDIFGPHNGCSSDYCYRYTFVLDKPYDTCDYPSLDKSKYPQIFYSPYDHFVYLAFQDYELADVLAVFVKFKA